MQLKDKVVGEPPHEKALKDAKDKLKAYEKACAGKIDWKHALEVIDFNCGLADLYEAAFFALLTGDLDNPAIRCAKNRVHESRYQGIVDYYNLNRLLRSRILSMARKNDERTDTDLSEAMAISKRYREQKPISLEEADLMWRVFDEVVGEVGDIANVIKNASPP